MLFVYWMQKRRERINERLKILQNLVPNGTKVRFWEKYHQYLVLTVDRSFFLKKVVTVDRKRMPTTQTVWISFSFQVDISTMLEEAMHYVKFLQLQIKVRLFAAHMTTSDYSLCSCQNCSASCIFFSGEKKKLKLLVFLQLLSSDEMWMYAPIAYNGMNIGIDLNLSQHW